MTSIDIASRQMILKHVHYNDICFTERRGGDLLKNLIGYMTMCLLGTP